MTTEIEALDADVSRLFDLYHQFKIRLADTEPGRKRTPRHIALTLIMARQVEHLDAIRVLTVAGRPFAAHAILRTIYEGYLYILLLGFHNGTIAKSRARGGERWTSSTKM